MRGPARFLLLAATLALAAPAPAHEQHGAGELTVEHPWARATAGGQRNGAAYVVIRNGGPEPERLVAAHAAEARAVELHSHEISPDGVARMRPVEAIDIPPGGEARLEPGGLHIMLLGLAGPLVEGASFPLTLVFERRGEMEIEVQVESLRASGGHDAHDAHGGHDGH